ncbi:MAG TPA: hypothetical protein VJT50_13625 [Pyrinomonadaceae bacterium]|nr:hypothetical protein [Pyrinomonadaceae bacterium]
MADDRMRNQEQQRNAGTKNDQGERQNAPSRNPNDDQLAGQHGGGGVGKDQGLGKGPMQGNTGRDEGGFEKDNREGTEGHSGRRNL